MGRQTLPSIPDRWNTPPTMWPAAPDTQPIQDDTGKKANNFRLPEGMRCIDIMEVATSRQKQYQPLQRLSETAKRAQERLQEALKSQFKAPSNGMPAEKMKKGISKSKCPVGMNGMSNSVAPRTSWCGNGWCYDPWKKEFIWNAFVYCPYFSADGMHIYRNRNVRLYESLMKCAKMGHVHEGLQVVEIMDHTHPVRFATPHNERTFSVCYVGETIPKHHKERVIFGEYTGYVDDSMPADRHQYVFSLCFHKECFKFLKHFKSSMKCFKSDGAMETERKKRRSVPIPENDAFAVDSSEEFNELSMVNHYQCVSVLNRAKMAVNAEWQVVYVDAWPHIILTSIPGVAVYPGDELLADFGYKWFERVDDECTRWMRIALLELRHCKVYKHPPPVTKDFLDYKRTTVDQLCGLCGGMDTAEDETGVICDGCNRSFHLQCIKRVADKPDGDYEWYCSFCVMLCERVWRASLTLQRPPLDCKSDVRVSHNASDGMESNTESDEGIVKDSEATDNALKDKSERKHPAMWSAFPEVIRGNVDEDIVSGISSMIPTLPETYMRLLLPCYKCYRTFGRDASAEICRISKFHLEPNYCEPHDADSKVAQLDIVRSVVEALRLTVEEYRKREMHGSAAKDRVTLDSLQGNMPFVGLEGRGIADHKKYLSLGIITKITQDQNGTLYFAVTSKDHSVVQWLDGNTLLSQLLYTVRSSTFGTVSAILEVQDTMNGAVSRTVSSSSSYQSSERALVSTCVSPLASNKRAHAGEEKAYLSTPLKENIPKKRCMSIEDKEEECHISTDIEKKTIEKVNGIEEAEEAEEAEEVEEVEKGEVAKREEMKEEQVAETENVMEAVDDEESRTVGEVEAGEESLEMQQMSPESYEEIESKQEELQVNSGVDSSVYTNKNSLISHFPSVKAMDRTSASSPQPNGESSPSSSTVPVVYLACRNSKPTITSKPDLPIPPATSNLSLSPTYSYFEYLKYLCVESLSVLFAAFSPLNAFDLYFHIDYIFKSTAIDDIRLYISLFVNEIMRHPSSPSEHQWMDITEIHSALRSYVQYNAEQLPTLQKVLESIKLYLLENSHFSLGVSAAQHLEIANMLRRDVTKEVKADEVAVDETSSLPSYQPSTSNKPHLLNMSEFICEQFDITELSSQPPPTLSMLLEKLSLPPVKATPSAASNMACESPYIVSTNLPISQPEFDDAEKCKYIRPSLRVAGKRVKRGEKYKYLWFSRAFLDYIGGTREDTDDRAVFQFLSHYAQQCGLPQEKNGRYRLDDTLKQWLGKEELHFPKSRMQMIDMLRKNKHVEFEVLL